MSTLNWKDADDRTRRLWKDERATNRQQYKSMRGANSINYMLRMKNGVPVDNDFSEVMGREETELLLLTANIPLQ